MLMKIVRDFILCKKIRKIIDRDKNMNRAILFLPFATLNSNKISFSIKKYPQ